MSADDVYSGVACSGCPGFLIFKPTSFGSTVADFPGNWCQSLVLGNCWKARSAEAFAMSPYFGGSDRLKVQQVVSDRRQRKRLRSPSGEARRVSRGEGTFMIFAYNRRPPNKFGLGVPLTRRSATLSQGEGLKISSEQPLVAALPQWKTRRCRWSINTCVTVCVF